MWTVIFRLRNRRGIDLRKKIQEFLLPENGLRKAKKLELTTTSQYLAHTDFVINKIGVGFLTNWSHI